MPKWHPPYPAEFRRRMVELVRAGREPEERQFEPSAQAIRNWVAQAARDDGHRQDGLTTDEREELRRLRRENKTLREEREILKIMYGPPLPSNSNRRDGVIRLRQCIRPLCGEHKHPGPRWNLPAPVLKSRTASKAAFFTRFSGAPS